MVVIGRGDEQKGFRKAVVKVGCCSKEGRSWDKKQAEEGGGRLSEYGGGRCSECGPLHSGKKPSC